MGRQKEKHYSEYLVVKKYNFRKKKKKILNEMFDDNFKSRAIFLGRLFPEHSYSCVGSPGMTYNTLLYADFRLTKYI